MECVMVGSITILAELGILWLLNKKETELYLDVKKYGALLLFGNIVLLILALVLQSWQGQSAVWYFGVCSYLFCMCVYDIRFRELPDYFHLLLILLYGYLWLTKQLPYTVGGGFMTALVVGLVFVVVYLIRKDAIGLGDIKVMVLCAQYVGLLIAGTIIRAMVAAFFCSVVLLLLKKVNTKSGLPFVPFLLLGALFM